ncbi:InlB B-repeat-containing protein [Paenibacillus ginsengarvi]|uniref:SLH domain-containing protein n=1 Tax=Paenibacillus ginsengarvi TaxID=400777 RepID=A0A3B0CBN4_9BACL|nr:InlB B-repeat-containing protein [Paenibacillus ginsengarvi]RKN82014.1 hypothetical protein D7M11_18750 [Paenibacillus ginsengarvi]
MEQDGERTEKGRGMSGTLSLRRRVRFVCLLLLSALLVFHAVPVPTANAVATGVTDGTYDFGGTLVALGGDYNKTGDKFLVNKDLVKNGTSLWPQTQTDASIPGYMMIKAEGASVIGSFTFQDLGFSATSSGLKLDFLHITLYDSKGSMITTIDNYTYAGGAKLSVGTGSVKLSSLLNAGQLFQMKNVSSIKILWTFEDDLAPSRLKLDNITIANVQKSKYTVYFNSNGGTAIGSQTVTYNGTATAPANPTRTGYTFGGWYKDANLTTPFAFTTAITGDLNLYAKWNAINYTVTYNSNGGTGVLSQSVGYNAIPAKPADPTKSGYTFQGWYKDTGLTQAYSFNTGITSNMTLYAKWGLNAYTVTFNSGGGTAVNNQTVNYGGQAAAPPNPTKAGYTFGGWYKDAGLTTAFNFSTAITGNTTLYAKWTVNTFAVTFNTNGGTAVSTQTVNYGSQAIAPPNPTKAGYTFGGWYKDAGLTTAFNFSTAISAATTLYAKWTIHTYTVTFATNGGTAVSNQTVSYGGTAAAPAAPTKTGSTFGGWYKDAGLTTAYNFSSAITGNTTLYAKWTLNNYTVTYASNGGTAVNSQTVTYNGTATEPANPTKTGYTFGGWYKDVGLTTAFSFAAAITGNTTLYAKWTVNSYTVAFESNGGTAVSGQTVSYGGKATTPAAPAKAGDTFGGWYSDVGLSTAFSFASAVTADVTLYAKWTPAVYTVTFATNGGTAVSGQSVNYGGTATEPAAPAKTGYTFGGWYSDAGLTADFLFTTAITGNTTLYAKWTPLSYTITFESNGGTAVNSQTVNYGSLATKPDDPTKTAVLPDLTIYTFGWWYTDPDFTQPFLFSAPIAGDMTLYANWTTDNKYAVTFNSNGGTAVSGQMVSSGNLATKPADPTKTGHTFGAWYADESLAQEFDFDTLITGNTTLHAKWIANPYTVTFVTYGGTPVSVQSVTYGSTALAPADPVKSGYLFGGWYVDAGLLTAFSFSTPITDNIALHAKWAEETYSVSFDSDGGTAVSSVTAAYNSTAVAPADPVKSGYLFGGWYVDAGFSTAFSFTTPITDDITLHAKWTAETYTVSFDSGGGTAVSSLQVSYNSLASEPDAPTKAGYTFAGWYTDPGHTTAFTFTTAITGSMLLYADWTTDDYTVMFATNEGTAVSSQEVSYGGLVAATPDPTKPGYTFGGWYTDETLTIPFQFTTPVTADITLYAKWATGSYAVVFDSRGGTAVNSQAVSYGGTALEPVNPVKLGYTFEGWYADPGLTSAFTFTTVITGNTTLYANWTTDRHTVMFDTNEGTVVSSQEVSYGGLVAATPDPTKPGYAFGGWYTDETLTIPFQFATPITEDITLHAKWATDSYSVVFNSGGGTAVNSQAVSYGASAQEPVNPAKAGHTFGGWYRDAGFTTPFSFSAIISGNTTLYAKWTASGNADLSGLIVSDTMLNPLFAADTTSYKASVLNGVSSVTVTGWVYESFAQLKVNGKEAFSGQATEAIPLNEGDNTIVIEVIAQNGTMKSYAVDVTRGPAAPVGLVALAGDGVVSLNWQNVQGAVSYSVYGGTSSRGYGSAPMATVSGATYGYTASGLENGTSYYFTVVANSDGRNSLYSNEAIAVPLSGDATLQALSLAGIELSPAFECGTFSYYASVYESSYETTVSSAVYERHASAKIVVDGKEVPDGRVELKEGTNTISIEVVAQNGMMKNYVITIERMVPEPSSPVSPASPGEEPVTGNTKPQQPTDGIRFLFNGRFYERIVTATAANRDWTVTVDALQLQTLLGETDLKPTVSLQIPSGTDRVTVVLPGDIIKAMERKQAVWEVQTPYGNYSVPAAEIGIETLAAKLGAEALKNIEVRLEIGIVKPDPDLWSADLFGNSQITLIGQPVQFRLTGTYQGETEEISRFRSFVKREIPLPDGMRADEATTAVVIEQDGKLRHVPTFFRQRDGKTFAVTHSLTNSVYAIIRHRLSFEDVEQSWSKQAVNDLASRLIVNGTEPTRYNPGAAVTRAEFSAIVVRALGVPVAGNAAGFKDVRSGDWYAGAVAAAQEYGIIAGYEDGSFRPGATITREEAMVIVMRAMEPAGFATGGNSSDIEAVLSGAAGSEAVSAWAKPAVATAVKLGIMNGSEAGLMPGSPITRAETAAVVQRMLQKAGLID